MLLNSRFCRVLFKRAVSSVIPILRTRRPGPEEPKALLKIPEDSEDQQGRCLVPLSVSPAQPPGAARAEDFQVGGSSARRWPRRKVLKSHPDMHKCKSGFVTIWTQMSPARRDLRAGCG